MPRKKFVYETQIIVSQTFWGPTRHLKIWRSDGEPIIAKWDTLQKIKSQTLGEDAMAIEIYPPESNVVNEINMRHLWEVPFDVRIPDLNWHNPRM